MKKFFIIAGEASGDVLGSKLIRELKLLHPNSEFLGVGGVLMQQEGLKSIFPITDLSVMGFLEIVPHLPKLLQRIKFTADEIFRYQPDFLITIDAPDFCFRVVKKLQKRPNFFANLKKTHLIAPSVWAYREGRAEKIAPLYNLLLAILPFEPPYFEKYGLKTVFIGHPIVENSVSEQEKNDLREEFRQQQQISNEDLVILVTPGSRNSEVKKIFPEFIAALNMFYAGKKNENFNVRVVIPVVEKTANLVAEMAKNLQMNYQLLSKEQKKAAFCAADLALAKSGTNAVEISLYRLPLIVAYKINFLTHFIVKRLVKIKFANLVNLILNQEIIPELLQKKCNPSQIAVNLFQLSDNKELAQNQVNKSQEALKIMGLGQEINSSKKAAIEILKL